MSEKTKIAWTDSTFNIAWGCVKVSPGCKNCYADALAERTGHQVWGPNNPRRVFGEKHWNEPRKWNRDAERAGKRHRVFCSSMCDIFEDHPTVAAELARLWPLIRDTPWLDWQLLTKRAERIRDCLPADWANGGGYPNVWLGVSVENQEYADERIPLLMAVPAKVLWLSLEPLIGPVNLREEFLYPDFAEYDDWYCQRWAVVGGESGSGFRPMQDDWALELLEQCYDADIPYFFKQASGPRPGFVPDHLATLPRQFPKTLTVTADLIEAEAARPTQKP